MLSILPLMAMLALGTFEANVSFSGLAGLPRASAYTAFCGRVCVPTLHEGPRPTHMFGFGAAYPVRERFGLYADVGVMPNIRYQTFATSPNTSGVSRARADRALWMFNAGAFVNKRSGFIRPYAYAGAGGLHDDYSWSTETITTQLVLPEFFFTRTVASPDTKNLRFNLQAGGGVRFYLIGRQGIRIFGELNNAFPGLERMKLAEGTAVATHKKGFGRFGIGYFIQWR